MGRKSKVTKLIKKNKSKVRPFRFTEDDYAHLISLSKDYDTNVSKIIDFLVGLSKKPYFRKYLDKYVNDLNGT